MSKWISEVLALYSRNRSSCNHTINYTRCLPEGSLPFRSLFLTLLLLTLSMNLSFGCFATVSTTAPVTGPPTSTDTTTTITTTGPSGCCNALIQNLTSTQFPDGVMTFTYNSDTCRSTVNINCSQPLPNLELNAAIVANGNNFINISARSTTFPATCDAQNQWLIGTPPLVINDIECILTNPPGTG